jgi:hypothetical protein
MWEGTTSRVMAADRPYGELYDFYSVSPEYFGFTLLQYANVGCVTARGCSSSVPAVRQAV